MIEYNRDRDSDRVESPTCLRVSNTQLHINVHRQMGDLKYTCQMILCMSLIHLFKHSFWVQVRLRLNKGSL